MRSMTKRPDLVRPVLAAGALALAGAASLSMLVTAPSEPAPPPPAASAVPAAPPPLPQPAAAPSPLPSLEGLRLHGLAGRGAIIGDADGHQRFYAVGREIRPGLSVARVEQSHVILAVGDAEVRLRFDGAVQATPPPAQAALQPEQAGAEALREETLGYRLGLAPRQVGGRVAGYVVRPDARLPTLERAGIRAGDVIVGVNGSGFDEERLLELAWQMANSDRTEFEVERGGRRIRVALEGR